MQIPTGLRELYSRLRAHRVYSWDHDYGTTEAEALPPEEETGDVLRADIVSSVLREINNPAQVDHALLLDIDYPAYLIPSTNGNSHLYLDVPGGIAHNDWAELMELLGRIGVVEEGYAGASLRRGYSSLRPPWVQKGRPILRCVVCDKRPDEIDEYIQEAKRQGVNPDDFAWTGEGTLDRTSGLFACTACYTKIGQPTAPGGWKGHMYLPHLDVLDQGASLLDGLAGDPF